MQPVTIPSQVLVAPGHCADEWADAYAAIMLNPLEQICNAQVKRLPKCTAKSERGIATENLHI